MAKPNYETSRLLNRPLSAEDAIDGLCLAVGRYLDAVTPAPRPTALGSVIAAYDWTVDWVKDSLRRIEQNAAHQAALARARREKKRANQAGRGTEAADIHTDAGPADPPGEAEGGAGRTQCADPTARPQRVPNSTRNRRAKK